MQIYKHYGRWKVYNGNLPRNFQYTIITKVMDLLPNDQKQVIRLFGFRNTDTVHVLCMDKEELNRLLPKAWYSQSGRWYANDTSYRKVDVFGCEHPQEINEIYTRDFKLINGVYYNKFFIEGDDLPDYHSLRGAWRNPTYNPEGELLGIEIEVKASRRTELIRYIKSLTPSYATIERDGSLDSSYGAEIVFRPMTVEEIYGDEFQDRFKKIKEYCTKYRQPIRYGMHLNVSRNWFDCHKNSELHQLKFAHLMNECLDLTEKIAGRSSNEYAVASNCRLAEKSVLPRKSFVNFGHSNRLEVRIFRSSLRPLDYMSQIEYTIACIEYSRQCSIQKLNEKNFLDWIEKSKKYESLHKVLFKKKAKV